MFTERNEELHRYATLCLLRGMRSYIDMLHYVY